MWRGTALPAIFIYSVKGVGGNSYQIYQATQQ
jgi:hypothetical protein